MKEVDKVITKVITGGKMTEEKQEFIEDLQEKNLAKNSALRKNTNGLNTDWNVYSQREIKAMSGETYSFTPDRPMEYEKFKTLPKKIQLEYLQGIVDKYTVGYRAVSMMFCISPQALYQVFKKLGVKGISGQATKENIDIFLSEFCSIDTQWDVEDYSAYNESVYKERSDIVISAPPIGITPEITGALHKVLADFLPVGSKVSINIEIVV